VGFAGNEVVLDALNAAISQSVILSSQDNSALLNPVIAIETTKVTLYVRYTTTMVITRNQATGVTVANVWTMLMKWSGLCGLERIVSISMTINGRVPLHLSQLSVLAAM
jgi:hypothetical protein